MRSKIVAAAITASMLGGAGAGIALFSPGLVGAQTESGTSSTATQTQTGDPAEPRALPRWVTDALKKLVDANTINQSQSDAVAQALTEAQPAKRPGDGHHRGGPGGPGRGPGHNIGVVAEALGMTEADLHASLRSGKSIADVAKEKNVDLQKVIDAIVAAETKRIDEAVAAGRFTQAQGDAKKAGLVERITERVNQVKPAREAPPA